MLIQCVEEVMDDSTLAEQEKDFVGDHLAEELGLLHLFSDSGIEPDDDFYYHRDDGAPVEVYDSVQVKKKKTINMFNDHLKATVRKKRKDCPKYIEVVRTFGHSIFRLDTFARKKVMVQNDSEDFEMHLQHIQSKSINEAHKRFQQSEIYHYWRHENRWIKKVKKGNGEGVEDAIIKPSVCLRLFFYAMCPCCKDPTQRDCAGGLVVGFTHLLAGLGKIRMTDYQDKKRLIDACDCVYHPRQINKEMWKSTSDFMTAILCTPKVYDEFENPELSKYSTQV